LDDIHHRISNAGDDELSLNSEIAALESAIAGYRKVLKEAGIASRLASLATDLNLWRQTAAHTGLALALGSPLEHSLLHGAASMVIHAGPQPIKKNNLSKRAIMTPHSDT
jgi:hypothetical protein